MDIDWRLAKGVTSVVGSLSQTSNLGPDRPDLGLADARRLYRRCLKGLCGVGGGRLNWVLTARNCIGSI